MQKAYNQFPALSAKQAKRKTLVSLTPLIDVVFILLIFFMLASSFTKWHSVEVNSSSSNAGGSLATDLPPFLVQVATDKLLLNNSEITLSSLLKQAKVKPSEQAIILQPLGDTPVQALIDILDELNAQGIAPLQLVQDPTWQASKQTKIRANMPLEVL
ncbi:ExbD/TolR family protein [Pseudoalteromonas ostreae]|uniref:ExbD/TolR family protein n=1 Tax=Pseudoalteromonas ostreae TaxID=2774154 RepID=UPI001B36EDFA|nr:biopolymer transporter ExbD [Pseudoalteromonas ostreae]